MDNNLPHYSRERLLGEGGMGKVYLARDNQLQRQVAIKELTYHNNADIISSLDNTTGDNSSPVNAALQEARLLARVNHTNIIQIYNVHDEGEHISLVMEYFKSKTLTQFQHETHSTLAQKLDLLQQLAAGLAAAHKNDVIHCDLKPTNILVDAHGHLKITDFGIALLANNTNRGNENTTENEASVDDTPLLFGSLLFMSPEQIKQQALDFRSDIFSLGIIAYQLIVGSHPFGRGSATDIADRICNTPPEHAKNLLLDAPIVLTDLLMEMLTQSVEQRRLTANDIENRLKHIRTALLQAEIDEQETLPLSNSLALPASTKNTQENAELVNTPQVSNTSFHNELVPTLESDLKKKKYWLPVTLSFLLTIIAVTSFWYFNSKEVAFRQVVILKPTFVDSQSMAAMQQDLVLSAVEDALRQAVINTKNMYLISQREVNLISKEYPNDLKKLKQAVGATDIITTDLECDNNRCKVHFSRLVASEKNKNTESFSFSVKAEKNWLAPVDNFNAIYSTSQGQFASIFPEYTDVNDTALAHKPIKENDYREYIKLYNQIKSYGNYSEASLTQLETLLEQSPYLYAAYALYSETAINLYTDTRNESHLKRLELVLQKSPPEYRYSLYHAIDSFWLAFNLQDFDAAQVQIVEAKKRGASNFILAELQAILYFSKGQFNKATSSFEEALALRPSTALLYNLALSYWELGELLQAEEALNKMLKTMPNNYRAIRLQANIWLFQGRINLAINAYEKIVKSLNNGKDLTNLGLAYALNQQYPKSYEFALKAYNKNPSKAVNILNLADIEMILGNTELATLYYRQVVELLSGSVDVNSLTYLAMSYSQLKEIDLALSTLNKAQVLSPKSGEVSFSSAVVYSLLKQNISAIHHVKSALKSNMGVAWFNLPWFDNLCLNDDFLLIMADYDNKKRCEL